MTKWGELLYTPPWRPPGEKTDWIQLALSWLSLLLLVWSCWFIGVLLLVWAYWAFTAVAISILFVDCVRVLVALVTKPHTNKRALQGLKPWLKRFFWQRFSTSWRARTTRSYALVVLICWLGFEIAKAAGVDVAIVTKIDSVYTHLLALGACVPVALYHFIVWAFFTPVYSRPTIVAVNRLECPDISPRFKDESSAFKNIIDDRTCLSDLPWSRALVPNPKAVPDDVASDWGSLDLRPCRVPCLLEGVDATAKSVEVDELELTPLYTNVKYPFKRPDPPHAEMATSAAVTAEKPSDWWNPTAIFCCEFESRPPPGHTTLLVFEGAGTWMAVFLNGSFVGISTDLSLPCAFVVDDFIEKSNRLTVVIPRFTYASYLEDQDQWWTAGIIRDVFLVYRSETGINRLVVTTRTLDTGNAGAAKGKVQIELLAKSQGRLQVRLLERHGWSDSAAQERVDVASFGTTIT